uniref:Uncharacterized protein n=1 Tax=Toxoplasma gondii (strain ATCC 50861 / VEG) TaxID=432359 RepID=A0A0F7UZ08_TOXGV|nr:TPA: hypothetical protein BN1205_018310 [Toxoplasma gondii VEG]
MVPSLECLGSCCGEFPRYQGECTFQTVLNSDRPESDSRVGGRGFSPSAATTSNAGMRSGKKTVVFGGGLRRTQKTSRWQWQRKLYIVQLPIATVTSHLAVLRCSAAYRHFVMTATSNSTSSNTCRW